MSQHVTNYAGVESRPRDYRGEHLKAGLPQHLLGVRQGEVTHACPECGIGRPREFCQVCLGVGQVSTERLDRYQISLENGTPIPVTGQARG